MPSASTLALFSFAAIALAIVPGPAVAYIVTQSVDKGRRAGIVSALGIASGGLVHVVAATVGLSALIASSAAAFNVVKFVDRNGSVALQVGILGLLFAAIALLSDLGYALLADALAGRVRQSGRGARLRRFATGGIFVALGVTAAAAHRS
jgi:threonine/homoserine/homoserine lactone efflux protein